MASVRQIARATNVSITTVSRVLNDHPEVSSDTRKLVLAAAEDAGYPLTRRRRQLSGNIALVFTGQMYWSQYDALLMNGILRAANDSQLDVLVLNLPRAISPKETYSQLFKRKGVRGAVLRVSARSRDVCEQIAEQGFPSIVVADRFDNPKVSYLSYYSGGDSERAIEHLIALGHRRIALATIAEPDRDHQDRCDAYDRALRKADIPLRDELIVHIHPDVSGGANAINLLMSLPQPPSAVFVTDPPATAGALRRIQEMGLRVPEDLSIIGFDDAEERHRVFPVLTAVCQDARVIGFQAAQWLAGTINGEIQSPLRQVKTTLFEINHSTGVPAKNPVRILPDGTRVASHA